MKDMPPPAGLYYNVEVASTASSNEITHFNSSDSENVTFFSGESESYA